MFVQIDPDTALTLIDWIDILHNPDQWTPFTTVGLFVLFEAGLPIKESIQNRWDGILLRIKAFFATMAMLVGSSQGFTGGCVVQIPQNWLSQQAFGRDWYPYGLVFREYFPEEWWWALRTFYILLATLVVFLWWKWIHKRYLPAIRNANIQRSETVSIKSAQ